MRSFLRAMLEASAPLVFGLVSQLFGSGVNGGPANGVNDKAARVSAAAAHGIGWTFMVMLIPLAASGVILIRARRSYPGDVAAASASNPARSETRR